MKRPRRPVGAAGGGSRSGRSGGSGRGGPTRGGANRSVQRSGSQRRTRSQRAPGAALPAAADLPDEKLHKLLARAGVGSRRAMEAAISAGRVTVNGAVATLGDRATAADTVCLDGRAITIPQPDSEVLPRVLVYNKPVGEVCTRSDPEGRRTCFESLPDRRGGRWVAVGRLDLSTSGLLLFTDAGELANRLMHPSTGLDREYAVRVAPAPEEAQLAALRRGVELEDGPARFTDIQAAGGEGVNQWFHVALMEGRNREVRRLWESQGLTVSRLKRVRFGPVVMPSVLRAGRWLELEESEVRALAGLAGHPVPPPGPSRRRGPRDVTRKRAPVLLPYPGMTFTPWK